MNKRDLRLAEDIFGTMNKRLITTDEDELNKGDKITLINNNCEFEFDNVRGVFEENLLYYYRVDLKLLSVDYSAFEPEKSNNGGAYAFAEAEVLRVWEKSY